jgi:murein DD-endopeptidase MepM/ murein hydrolase activator NlpD
VLRTRSRLRAIALTFGLAALAAPPAARADLPSLSFGAPSRGPVPVRVLDTAGRQVAAWTVTAQIGVNSVVWNGRTADGIAPAGHYRLEVGSEARTTATSVAQRAVPVALPEHAFPIDGPHDLGRSIENRFGGGRGHQGQDLFADCGTPVVAAQGGRVREADFQSAAGNFVVIETPDGGPDHAYMHLQAPARVHVGERIAAGTSLGAVGATGRADGCHLHFELWTAPGWYAGGQPRDPLPLLRGLDAAPR